MTLTDLISADIGTVFMNTNDFARSVVYRRGAAESEALSAFPIDQNQEVVNEDGFGTGIFLTGWAFEASALQIDSEQITPRSGDRIEETLNGVDIAYEVMPSGPNKKPFIWEDDSRLMIVVYCKEVKR